MQTSIEYAIIEPREGRIIFPKWKIRVASTIIPLSPYPAPMKTTNAELANAIRALSMDAVQAANSGHPGMPMGMAEIAVAL